VIDTIERVAPMTMREIVARKICQVFSPNLECSIGSGACSCRSQTIAAADAALSALRTDVEGTAWAVRKHVTFACPRKDTWCEAGCVCDKRSEAAAKAAINYWLGEEAR
jgi:hypothetical protein